MSQRDFEPRDHVALRRQAARAGGEAEAEAGRAPHPLVALAGRVGNAQVARMLAQREEEEEEVQARHDPLQREGVGADRDPPAPEVGLEGGPLSPALAGRINAQRGGGAALDGGTRASMEGAFGASFEDVRLHTDAESDALNRSISAKAFTTGSDIFFRRDASPGDHGLLAHELTHVVQQRAGGGGGGMSVGPAGDAHEQQADAASLAVTSGAAAQAQREGEEEEEVQAQHDLAQREGEEEDEVQAQHDLAQREDEEEEEVQAQHDLAQREDEQEEEPA